MKRANTRADQQDQRDQRIEQAGAASNEQGDQRQRDGDGVRPALPDAHRAGVQTADILAEKGGAQDGGWSQKDQKGKEAR